MWDQEDGWGARVWKKKLINKKYFPPECVFSFKTLKEQFTEDLQMV